MKKICKRIDLVFILAAIGLLFTACQSDSSEETITLRVVNNANPSHNLVITKLTLEFEKPSVFVSNANVSIASGQEQTVTLRAAFSKDPETLNSARAALMINNMSFVSSSP